MAGTGASGGRNALSTQAHVLAGTFRADRHGEHQTPEAPVGRPEPPQPLDGIAREAWDQLCGDLDAEGRLVLTDAGAIYQAAKTFAAIEQLEAEKAEAKAAVDRLDESFGEVEKSDRIQFFIEVGKMRALAASYDSKITAKAGLMRQWLVELGLTPAAKGRVKLPAKPPQSAVAAFRAAKA